MSSSSAPITSTPDTLSAAPNPLRGILVTIRQTPGVTLAILAGISLLLGLWLANGTIVNRQHDFLADQTAPGCPMVLDSRQIRLAIDKQVISRGRTVTCRHYDGHPVLIYTTPEN